MMLRKMRLYNPVREPSQSGKQLQGFVAYELRSERLDSGQELG